MRLLLLFLCLTISSLAQFQCFGLGSKDPNVCNGGGACVGTNLCACFSGRAGPQCLSTTPAQCTVFSPPQPLITNYPPFISLEGTFFVNDTLFLAVDLPIVRNRLAVVLSIQNSLNPACRYPGTFFMNTINTTGACFNQFSAAIPFTEAINCGWNVTIVTDPLTGNVTAQVFSGYVFVTYLEEVDAGEKKIVLRVIRAALPIAIRFNVFANETMTPIVGPGESMSAVTLAAFVLGQKAKVDKKGLEQVPFIPNSGVLRFVTAVPFPFLLDPNSAIIISAPAGLSLSGVMFLPDGSNCTNTTDPFCNQAWQVILDIETACSFSGVYIFNFTAVCRGGVTPCTTVGLPPQQFVFTLDMADFCATISLQVPLMGFLESSTMPTFVPLTTTFVQGSAAYFRAIVSSPKATIMSATLQRVTLVNNDTRVLYNRHITQAGSMSSFALIQSPSPNEARFSFRLVNLPFETDPTLFTVNALIRVQYSSMNIHGVYEVKEMDVNMVQGPQKRGEQDFRVSHEITIESTPQTAFATQSLFSFMSLIPLVLYLM